MGFRLRQIEAESKFCRELKLEMIEPIISRQMIRSVLAAEGQVTHRERKLNLTITVLVLIMMNIYTTRSMGSVLSKISQGLRFIWPDPDYVGAQDSALSYRRRQVGVRPLVSLFKQVCRPLASAETPGAFLFGLRLMALDGTVEEVADTPTNAAAFGRPSNQHGQGGFPQVRGLYLVECGTHAIIDAGFWPYHQGEHQAGYRLLRSVEAGMLVMWDRGLHSYEMFRRTLGQGGQVLSRIGANIKPSPVKALPDGSYLAHLRPAQRAGYRKKAKPILVRVIEYTLTDPNLPGYGERHRLVTTLLDPTLYPITELICAYHQRWEAEITIDEVQTHQRLAAGPLRSLSPVGVMQELYGLLLAHYLIRTLMFQAAEQAGLDPDRLSFIGAVRLLQDALPEFQMTAPSQLPALYQRLLRDLARQRLPQRRLRSNPRVVKRRATKFKTKRARHRAWPQPSVSFPEAILIQPALPAALPLVISLPVQLRPVPAISPI